MTINPAHVATDAIIHEGVEAYFPNLDISPDLAARILGDYLTDHPDVWTPAGEDHAWTFRGSIDDLVRRATGAPVTLDRAATLSATECPGDAA